MFRNLKLQTKLIAIAVPALVVLAIVSAYAVLLSSHGSSSLEDLEGDIRTLGIVCMAALLLSALTVLIIGRSIVDPVEDLKRSALELANERLPLLVESIRSPGAGVPPFEPLANDHDDELGELVDALNTIHDRVFEIAGAQQSVVQAGVSDLVVNLAQRNQSLLDRQLDLIDRLERDEQDPDRLEELFGLDHLATRMRRNAESLLVLAGSEPVRRRHELIQIADSVRMATSEIENYQHVNLTTIEPTEISSALALDLAHLLSELLENATKFSPPERPVEVRGSRQADGSYVVSVVDRGLGMSDERLADANGTLTSPPELSLGMSRSLGFVVVGHLARRLDAKVVLSPTPSGGTTATVLVTAERLAEDAPVPRPSRDGVPDLSATEPSLAEPSLAEPSVAEPSVVEPSVVEPSDVEPSVAEPGVAEPSLADARGLEPSTSKPSAPEPIAPEPLPQAATEEQQIPAALAGPRPAPPSPPVVPAAETAPDPLAMFRHDNHAVNEYPDKLSEAVPDGVAFDVGVEALLRQATPTPPPVDEGHGAVPSKRSPKEIRTMLSRYRDGLKGRPLSDLSSEASETSQPEDGDQA